MTCSEILSFYFYLINNTFAKHHRYTHLEKNELLNLTLLLIFLVDVICSMDTTYKVNSKI